jgi:hypothetical protein
MPTLQDKLDPLSFALCMGCSLECLLYFACGHKAQLLPLPFNQQKQMGMLKCEANTIKAMATDAEAPSREP